MRMLAAAVTLVAVAAAPVSGQQVSASALSVGLSCLGAESAFCTSSPADIESEWRADLGVGLSGTSLRPIRVPERVAPIQTPTGSQEVCPQTPCNRAPDHMTADVGSHSGITAFLASAPLVTVLALATKFIAGAELEPTVAPFMGGENADKFTHPPKKPVDRR